DGLFCLALLEGVFCTRTGSMASGSKRTRSSLSPTNQTQTMPVTLLSSKMLVFTESTVMVGPPDFSTTRSPDLMAVIGRFHDQQCVGASYLNRGSQWDRTVIRFAAIGQLWTGRRISSASHWCVISG